MRLRRVNLALLRFSSLSLSLSLSLCVCVCVCVCTAKEACKRGLQAYLMYASVSKETQFIGNRDPPTFGIHTGKQNLLSLAYLRFAQV